jgi:hypothetical protein
MILRKARAPFSKSANLTGAAIKRHLLLALALVLAATRFAGADDFGPHGDIRELRFVAQRLLAHTAREWKTDPAATRITDVVVVKDAALLSWDIGDHHGLMGLIRQYGRWWDALDAYGKGDCWDGASTSYPLPGSMRQYTTHNPTTAALLAYGLPADLVAQANHNSDIHANLPTAPPVAHTLRRNLFLPHCDVQYYQIPKLQPLQPGGGSLSSFRTDTSGYEISVRYARNNSRDAMLHIPYARPPTAAEIMPYPTTLRFVSTAVLYFDLTIEGSAPVTFQPGTTIDIWFPFVLDDTLAYDLTIGFANEPIGPIYAKPFDNVLHYKLPGFTAIPGKTLMAEIDGNWPSDDIRF